MIADAWSTSTAVGLFESPAAMVSGAQAKYPPLRELDPAEINPGAAAEATESVRLAMTRGIEGTMMEDR